MTNPQEWRILFTIALIIASDMNKERKQYDNETDEAVYDECIRKSDGGGSGLRG
jgi:hypothetical protein